MQQARMPILEYARSRGVEMDPKIAGIHGRALTAYCKQNNIPIGKHLPMAKVWGMVNTYPVEVLDAYFTDERLTTVPLTAKAKKEMQEEAERLEAIRILDKMLGHEYQDLHSVENAGGETE